MVSVQKSKGRSSKSPLLSTFFLLALVGCVSMRSLVSERIVTKSTPVNSLAATATTATTATTRISYDPKNCTLFKNGSCEDEDGGAWSYKSEKGSCVYSERQVPRDSNAANFLPTLFPGGESILDFGGGVGAYLVGFRNANFKTLVTVEPQPLGNCLFKGLQQDMTDWINTPLNQLPKDKYDVVMTIEVAEHIPVHFHQHLLKALAQATKKYVVFSAAHPGQAGQGHVGPSMKPIEQWKEEAKEWASLTVNDDMTQRLHNVSSRLLRRNCVIFQK